MVQKFLVSPLNGENTYPCQQQVRGSNFLQWPQNFIPCENLPLYGRIIFWVRISPPSSPKYDLLYQQCSFPLLQQHWGRPKGIYENTCQKHIGKLVQRQYNIYIYIYIFRLNLTYISGQWKVPVPFALNADETLSSDAWNQYLPQLLAYYARVRFVLRNVLLFFVKISFS